MANIKAAAAGNFNATTTWTGGVVPVAGDLAFANGFAVAVTANATCASVSTAADATSGAVAGGSFTLSAGVTLTANSIAGTTVCVIFSGTTGNSASLVGSATGGTGTSSYGANNTSTGTLNITGNVAGGTGAGSTGANNASTGTLNITGNVTGGSANVAYGANNVSTGILTITGNVTGGTVSYTAYGASNASIGILTISGSATGGTTAPGAVNASATAGATLYAGTAVGNAWYPGAALPLTPQPGVVGVIVDGRTIVGGYAMGTNGMSPALGYVYLHTGGISMLLADAIVLDRITAVHGAGSYVAPDVSGIPTLLTRLTSTRAGNLDNLDVAVSTRNATVPPSVSAIRSEIDANSTKLDVAVSTRNATAPDNTSIATILTRTDVATSTRSTYAGADTAGTATLLARLTSTRAALLDNLDAAVSGIAASVWAVATRTLTAISDSAGVSTLLTRLTSTRAGNLDNLDATVSSRNAIAPPSDYQQRAVAVVLPDPAPSSYGGGGLTVDQAAGLAAIKAKTDLISAGAITIASPVDVIGSNITVRAGDTWSIPIDGLGNLTGVDKLWFSVNAPGAADTAAKLFLELAAGLTRVNGAAYTPTTDGAITVTDATAGNITLAIDEAVTAALGGSQPTRWTIKKRIGGDDTTLATGLFTISKAGIGATN